MRPAWGSRLVRGALTGLFALLLVAGAAPAGPATITHRLTLLHFNDFHGQLAPYRDPEGGPVLGGIARLAGAVAQIRAEDPGCTLLVLFAGDLLQGTLLSSLFHGHPDVEMLNDLGLDAAALGNHELDYGQDNLRVLLGSAHYPVLAANVHLPWVDRSAPSPGLQASTVLQGRDGLRVGVLGLTTGELVTATHPRNTRGVVVDDPVATARRLLPGLVQASDIQILLSHLGYAEDRRVAEQTEGLDLIVGGHNHFAFEAPRWSHGVPIVQAGDRGRFLGRLDLTVTDGRVALLGYHLLPMDASVPEDPRLAARVAALSAQVDRDLDRVVGRTAVLLDGRRETVRRGESNLGSFVADLARELARTDLALLNAGTFRSSIAAGPVTLGQLQRVFPFANTLVTGRISGALLAQALERSAGLDPEDNPGGFLQVSGLRFVIRGGHAETIRVGGEPLRLDGEYRLVTSDFLAAGGDGYAMLTRMGGRLDTGNLLLDLVAAALRERGEIRPGTDGRIRREE